MTDALLAKMVRLAETARGALSTGAEGGFVAAGLTEAYSSARAAVLDALSGLPERKEFEALAPPLGAAPSAAGAYDDPFQMGAASASARARLGALVGWIDGWIKAQMIERQMQADAQAYAEARVRADRGVGFQ